MADTLAQRQIQLGNYVLKGYPNLGLPGWPMSSACAVVGNATQENLCLPITPGVKDHGSDGVMQWREGRLTEMKSWCAKNFGPWNTLEAQAAFMMYECKRDYSSLYLDLCAGSKTIPTLTANFCGQYERPAAASSMLDKRIKYAEDAHALLVAGAPPSIPVTGKVAAGTMVATAAAATASQANGLPVWGTVAIVVVGLAGVILLAILEAKKK